MYRQVTALQADKSATLTDCLQLLFFATLGRSPQHISLSKQTSSTLKDSRWPEMQSKQRLHPQIHYSLPASDASEFLRCSFFFLKVISKMQCLQKSPISTASLWYRNVGMISTALEMAVILIYGFPSFPLWSAARVPRERMTSVCHSS